MDRYLSLFGVLFLRLEFAALARWPSATRRPGRFVALLSRQSRQPEGGHSVAGNGFVRHPALVSDAIATTGR